MLIKMKFRIPKGNDYFSLLISVCFGYWGYSAIETGTIYSKTQRFDIHSDPQGFWFFITFCTVLSLFCLILAFFGDDNE